MQEHILKEYITREYTLRRNAVPRRKPVTTAMVQCAVLATGIALPAWPTPAWSAPIGPAPACHLASGAQRTPVLELYTSEGCSSCPPADRWLSMTFDASRPPIHVVPLAFHVDYWDRLGWPDRFSDHAYSLRQNEVARRAQSRTVYTPQFVLDGTDARPGGIAIRLAGHTAAVAREPAARAITADVARSPDGGLRVVGVSAPTTADSAARGGDTYVVLYQNGLTSRIAAGENAGRTLRHDFVVRRFSGPFGADASGRATFDVRWSAPPEFRAENAGVAVFTEDPVTGRTLQAVAGPLCPGG